MSTVERKALIALDTPLKTTEEQTKLVEQRDFDLFNFSPLPMWVYDTQTLQILAANEAAQKDYGYTLTEFLSSTVKVLWPKYDITSMMQMVKQKVKPGLHNKASVRHIKKDGTIIHVDIESKPLPSWGNNTRIVTALDITLSKILNDLESHEKKVLEMNSTADVSLKEVLTYYVKGIESLFPKMQCTIMQVKNNRIYSWVPSSLPKRYTDKIEGLQIGINAGSCGTAAFLKKTIIVSNISIDPRWDGYKELALSCDLLACWSQPIINSENEVMATFAIYYKETKEPNDNELKVIARASSLLKIVLENRQYAEALNENCLLIAQTQEIANFGNWSWDIKNDVVSWSESLYRIYGLEKNKTKITFKTYLELLHPEDRSFFKETIQQILKNHKDIDFQERIIRPDGVVRHLKSWCKLITEEGQAVKVIGACIDVTQHMENELKIKVHLDRYNAVSKATSDTIWDYDILTGDVIWSNSITEIFGYDKTEGKYQWWYKRVHPDDLNRITNIVSESIEGKRSRWVCDYRFRCADGSYKFVLDRGFLIYDDNGRAIRMIGAMQDITEQAIHARKMEQQNHRLRDIAWAQTHLVRAPLARILGIVDLLNDAPDKSLDKELLNYLRISAKELDKVIKGIIDKSI